VHSNCYATVRMISAMNSGLEYALVVIGLYLLILAFCGAVWLLGRWIPALRPVEPGPRPDEEPPAPRPLAIEPGKRDQQ
jgi:hypothetical protein